MNTNSHTDFIFSFTLESTKVWAVVSIGLSVLAIIILFIARHRKKKSN